MKKELRRYLLLFCGVLSTLTFVSCHYSDGIYDDLIGGDGGTEDIRTNFLLKGFVYGKDNSPINAWASLLNAETGESVASVVTTYEAGYPMYHINLDDEGVYTLVVGSSGYETDTISIDIDGTQSVIYNDFHLKYTGGGDVNPNNPYNPNPGAGGSGSGTDVSVTIDYLDGNNMVPVSDDMVYGYLTTKCTGENLLAKIKIGFSANGADAIDMYMSAVYPRKEYVVPNPDGDSLSLGYTMCVGTDVTSMSGNTVTGHGFEIDFQLDNAMAQRSHVRYFDEESNSWEMVESRVERGSLKVNTTKYGRYGVFADFDYFKVDTIPGDQVYEYHWYNDYAPGGVWITSVKYGLNNGYEIVPEVGMNVLQALMIEYMARSYGYLVVRRLETLDLNENLLYMRGMWAIATQENIRYVLKSDRYSVDVTKYGNVYAKSWQYGKGIDHKGGSSD